MRAYFNRLSPTDKCNFKKQKENYFEKIPYNFDYQIGVANFADQKMMEIT